jgi:hypothetical protein
MLGLLVLIAFFLPAAAWVIGSVTDNQGDVGDDQGEPVDFA